MLSLRIVYTEIVYIGAYISNRSQNFEDLVYN